MGTSKLKGWEWYWGIGFSLVGGMTAIVGGAAFVAGDLVMSLWFSIMTAACSMGALVAFTPSRRVKRVAGTELPYCSGCDDRHDGPRCY